MTRDLSMEVDALKQQMAELQQLVRQAVLERKQAGLGPEVLSSPDAAKSSESNSVYYSGQVRLQEEYVRWEPQERRMDMLLALNSEKAAKIVAALGHKQRLDILKAVLHEPLTGAELVERLNMGTTGQLYHHLKALTGADLLVQHQGGRYALAAHRSLPFLLLLAAVSDLLDMSDYLDMAETRNNASVYLGASQNYDPHHLLWAVMENSIHEHIAGFCREVRLFVHDDGSVTVSDDGRGVPVHALPHSNTSVVQSVLTDMSKLNRSAPSQIPGAEKEIGMAVVNALSQKLAIEIRRDGKIYRQEYKQGIPQSGLMVVGLTSETGTSVTFKPDPELFEGSGFDQARLEQRKEELAAAYPELLIEIYN